MRERVDFFIIILIPWPTGWANYKKAAILPYSGERAHQENHESSPFGAI
jgi:hypothetical protein